MDILKATFYFAIACLLAINLAYLYLNYELLQVVYDSKRERLTLEYKATRLEKENYLLHKNMMDFFEYTKEQDAKYKGLREENEILLFQLNAELAKKRL